MAVYLRVIQGLFCLIWGGGGTGPVVRMSGAPSIQGTEAALEALYSIDEFE